MDTHTNCWVEIDRSALEWNTRRFRQLVGDNRLLMAVVKANAYGHGMLQVASIALEAGADWLGVFSIDEGLELREGGLEAPVLVLGPPEPSQIEAAFEAGLRLTVPSAQTARTIVDAWSGGGNGIVHLKLETGTNRQGMSGQELIETSEKLEKSGLVLEGAYTHFADIEDTTDHRFAQSQLAAFEKMLGILGDSGVDIPIPHTACSAAAILFPSTYFEMVRVGISLYGLWPSRETRVSAGTVGRGALELRPAMTWKTRIAQIKPVEVGAFVGYGRTYRATRATRIAILPVGYADGYDRRLSGGAHVLVRGCRAPVVGRICMNLTMVDVTDVAGAAAGDEVVLMGTQGDETVSAEDLAGRVGTINYEVVTRLAPGRPRVVV